MEPEAGIVLGAGEGEPVGTSVLKAARPELSFIELQVRPGGGVTPHFHKEHSDSFYVLEGEVELHVGDEVVSATPGTYVLAPPHAVHWFRNVSESPARMLNLHTPGGFAEYMRERTALAERGREPDAAFFERHDIFDVYPIEPNAYSPTWHAVFGATQPDETTAREVAFLAQVLPLPGDGPVLDLCCGSGRHLAGLAALGYQVFGVERDPAVARAARERVPAARVVEGDANRLAELVDEPFAGAICMWQSFGFGTSEENAALLAALAKVLEPDGRLVLDVYNRSFLETRTGTRTLERDGRSVTEQLGLTDDRLTVALDYGSGVEDVFSWQVFTTDELAVAARPAGLELVLACSTFVEHVPPAADEPRMQLVFARA